MLDRMEQIEKLMDRFVERMQSLEKQNGQLNTKLEEGKKVIQEKDLELIRLRKENQRLVEQAEREKMSLQKERQQIENRLAGLLERLDKVSPEGVISEMPNGVPRK